MAIEDAKHVREAIRRIEDFIHVSAGRPKGEVEEAVALLAQGAGLSQREHDELRRRIAQLTDDESCISWCMIGAVLGVFLADERSGD